MDLGGAVALVTGGNGGLGQRICHALAKEGVHVAVMYAQSCDQAESVARELTSRHQINTAAFACDIADGAAVERVVGDVTSRFSRLDIRARDPRGRAGSRPLTLDYARRNRHAVLRKR
jgi:3-oxoacyl-[acyl-carrier protein] reductase